MSEMAETIRLHGYVNPLTEPKLAKAVKELEKVYSTSAMVKEGIRCLARREGLISEHEGILMSEGVPG